MRRQHSGFPPPPKYLNPFRYAHRVWGFCPKAFPKLGRPFLVGRHTLLEEGPGNDNFKDRVNLTV